MINAKELERAFGWIVTPHGKVTFPELVQADNLPAIPSGNVFYVDSNDGTDDTNHGIGPGSQVFATLDYAVGQCTANNGDVIYVMPGHTENVATAGAIALDVAGVTIIGVGHGTLKPKFTLTAAAATITVSAANVIVKGLTLSANDADVVTCFSLAAAKYFCLIDCDFRATATNMNFLTPITVSTTNNAADGLSIIGCSWIEVDTADLSFLSVLGDLDQLLIQDCYINIGVNTNDLPILGIVATGKDITNIRVLKNKLIRLNDANPLLFTMDTTTANTGIIAENFIRHLDIASELLITAASNIGHFDNKTTAVVDLSGVIMPAADA